MTNRNANGGRVCDWCEKRQPIDASAAGDDVRSWLCKACAKSPSLQRTYRVLVRKGPAWLAHLEKLRARVKARLPLFPRRGTTEDPRETR